MTVCPSKIFFSMCTRRTITIHARTNLTSCIQGGRFEADRPKNVIDARGKFWTHIFSRYTKWANWFDVVGRTQPIRDDNREFRPGTIPLGGRDGETRNRLVARFGGVRIARPFGGRQTIAVYGGPAKTSRKRNRCVTFDRPCRQNRPVCAPSNGPLRYWVRNGPRTRRVVFVVSRFLGIWGMPVPHVRAPQKPETIRRKRIAVERPKRNVVPSTRGDSRSPRLQREFNFGGGGG